MPEQPKGGSDEDEVALSEAAVPRDDRRLYRALRGARRDQHRGGLGSSAEQRRDAPAEARCRHGSQARTERRQQHEGGELLAAADRLCPEPAFGRSAGSGGPAGQAGRAGPAGPQGPAGVIGAVTVRSATSSPISGGTAENGVALTGDVSRTAIPVSGRFRQAQTGLTRTRTWSCTSSGCGRVFYASNNVVGFQARGANDSGQSSSLILSVLCYRA